VERPGAAHVERAAEVGEPADSDADQRRQRDRDPPPDRRPGDRSQEAVS